MAGKSLASPAHVFYAEVLKILKDSKFTFMVAGGFAVNYYTGLSRPTKDIDIFVKAGDYPKILNKFTSLGYKTQVSDERWIAKIFKGKLYVDLIFGSSNLVAPVTDDWFKDSKTAKFFNYEVKIPSVTDLIWSKVFIQNRDRYDGADVAHLTATSTAQHCPSGMGRQPDGPKFCVGSQYDIHLVKEEAVGMWKIKKWVLSVTWTQGDPSVMKSMRPV